MRGRGTNSNGKLPYVVIIGKEVAPMVINMNRECLDGNCYGEGEGGAEQ